MALVVSGRLNKQVGGELGISEITVKAHRGRMMRKMSARTLPDLVNMAARLQLTPFLKRDDRARAAESRRDGSSCTRRDLPIQGLQRSQVNLGKRREGLDRIE
jgi:hypothetical protein